MEWVSSVLPWSASGSAVSCWTRMDSANMVISDSLSSAFRLPRLSKVTGRILRQEESCKVSCGLGLELGKYCFCHSLLAKASHNTRSDSREGIQTPPLDGSYCKILHGKAVEIGKGSICSFLKNRLQHVTKKHLIF